MTILNHSMHRDIQESLAFRAVTVVITVTLFNLQILHSLFTPCTCSALSSIPVIVMLQHFRSKSHLALAESKLRNLSWVRSTCHKDDNIVFNYTLYRSFDDNYAVCKWNVGHWSAFYIRGSMHRNSRLKKSNKMQQYADIYVLLNYSTRFRHTSRPSSGVHKTVVAASGTDHTVRGASFIKRDQISPYLVTFEEACSSDSMICTRGCNYSIMYSWWWARCMPKTCRVI